MRAHLRAGLTGLISDFVWTLPQKLTPGLPIHVAVCVLYGFLLEAVSWLFNAKEMLWSLGR